MSQPTAFKLFDLNHKGRNTFYNTTWDASSVYLKLIQEFLQTVLTLHHTPSFLILLFYSAQQQQQNMQVATHK